MLFFNFLYGYLQGADGALRNTYQEESETKMYGLAELSPEVHKVLSSAQAYASKVGATETDPIHLLHTVLSDTDPDSRVGTMLAKHELTTGALQDDWVRWDRDGKVEARGAVSGRVPTDNFATALVKKMTLKEAECNCRDISTLDDLLIALAMAPCSMSSQFFLSRGIDYTTLRAEFQKMDMPQGVSSAR